MTIEKNYDLCSAESDEVKTCLGLELNEHDDHVSKLLDNYEIEVLDAHLKKSIKKNLRLNKRIEKLEDELELMTKCLVEMVEKNYRLEEEIKNLKKEDPL